MSEIDRVFSGQSSRAKPARETRHIVTAPRRSRSGMMAHRVVEVVHVARSTPKPLKNDPQPVRRDVCAANWPDGFRAKAASPAPVQDAPSVVPEPASPAVHVMPAWEPSVQQPAWARRKSAELPNSTPTLEHQEQRDAASTALKGMTRRFADPFAADEDGANCIRCGYLVEPARERRGLWTCSQCG
jgi:hypothetical protein